MEQLNTAFLLIVILWCISMLILLIIILKRFFYIKKSLLTSWGIFLIIDTLVAFFLLFHPFLAKKLPFMPNNFFFSNTLLFLQAVFWAKQYKILSLIKKPIVILIYIIFVVIWLFEFRNNMNEKTLFDVEMFRLANIYLNIIICVFAGIYLFKMLKDPFSDFLENPTFWIASGWFFYNFISLTTFFTKIMNYNNPYILFLYNWMVFFTLITNVLYIIGFWKTKKWITHQRL